MTKSSMIALHALLPVLSSAWVPSHYYSAYNSRAVTALESKSSVHGENSCFLPLKQLGQDDFSPRIVQIAGAYPGLTKDEFMAVSSEPAPEAGQWSYDFSDPDGPQLGTVALEGTESLNLVEDPVALIADHQTLGIQLPKVIADPVDLIVLVDRARTGFSERKFLVIDDNNGGLQIAAFDAKSDLPAGAEILGRVELVQIPWLPGMAPTKTGFAEADEYFTM